MNRQAILDALADDNTAERLDAIEQKIDALTKVVNGPSEELVIMRVALEKAAAGAPMTKRETALWLGCSQRQVDYHVTAGMPCYRPGGPGGSPRFIAADCLAWMKSRAA